MVFLDSTEPAYSPATGGAPGGDETIGEVVVGALTRHQIAEKNGRMLVTRHR